MIKLLLDMQIFENENDFRPFGAKKIKKLDMENDPR